MEPVLPVDARNASLDDLLRLIEVEQRRASRIAIINRIGRLVTGSLSLDELLKTVVHAFDDYLNYSHVAILLIDPEDPTTLVLRARGGIYAQTVQGDYRQSIEQGTLGMVARTRRPRLVNDVYSDPYYIPIPGGETIRAELAVPLAVGERLIGVLNVESEQPFAVEDSSSLEIIADQLAVAIDHARLFADMERSLDEMRLLYETSRRISTAMDVDEVIAAYLEQVAARGRFACTILLYEFDAHGNRAHRVVRGTWNPQLGVMLRQESHPYTRDALDDPLDAGQTVMMTSVFTDPRAPEGLREIQRRAGRTALAMIPLIARGIRIGLVILSHARRVAWGNEDLRPYQATAAQLATAIDSRQQNLLLYERGQQLAVLHERGRLARELHDSVTQLIFSMTLIAQSLAPAWRRDSAEGERRVQRLLELSQAALGEMRALLAELRPTDPARLAEEQPLPQLPMLERMRREGLPKAILTYGQSIARDSLVVEVRAERYTRRSLDHEETFFRIAQEALNNVVKHAQAETVVIEVATEDGRIWMTVTDDGVGMSPQPGAVQSGQQGLGLQTMSERAEILGGQVTLTSAPGGGTRVEISIPQPDE